MFGAEPQKFGFIAANFEKLKDAKAVKLSGDHDVFGDGSVMIKAAPGHTPGHVIFFHPDHRLAMVGDVLFQGSIGRSDFPRGDHATLVNSIRSQLWPLGDDVAFIPGHGPMSTFGEERQSNPFVRDGA